MGYLSYLVIFATVTVLFLGYFGRNERFGGEAIVWTGIGLLAIAAVCVLVGYTMGAASQVAHSDPIQALGSVALFYIAWPFISLFTRTAIDMPAQPRRKE